MSAVAGTSDTIHLVFSGASSAAPTNGAVYYVKYSSGAWGTQITLDSNTTNQAPQISIDGSGNLYAFWIRANTIFYKKGVSPYAAGNWDASPTTFYNTGTNNSLSSSYTQGNSTIQLLWTQGTGSPFSIEFATLNISSNATPAAPTLNAPSSGATGVAVTPQFQLSTTDADSDYLRYDIVVYQSDCSTLVRDIDQTSSQTGWSGQDQQTSTAYTGATTLGSSTMANHTYQAAALSYSTTYCWKGRAIDPGGSNTWSGYSSTQSFSTGSALPSAPVNINGGANVRGGSSIQ
jgi:hypothetical protein